VDKPLSVDGAGVPVLAGTSEVGVERVFAADAGSDLLKATAEGDGLDAMDEDVI